MELVAPARVRSVLRTDCFAQLRTDTRMSSGSGVHLALEHLHGIGRRVARRIQPMLDRRLAEADALARGRVLVRARCQLVELRPELSRLRRAGQKRTHTEKRKSAHRTRIGMLSSFFMASVPTGIRYAVGGPNSTRIPTIESKCHLLRGLIPTIAILARTLSVVTGAINRKLFSTALAPGPKCSSREAGISAISTGVAKNALASSQNGPSAKTVCHHVNHRRTVRAGTPSIGGPRRRVSAAAARPATLATITSAPTYTLRPRNRTEGGGAR